MGPIGVPEMILIFVLALLIFGPKKLPELGRSFGRGVAEFRRASNELRTTFQREMQSIEQENQEVKTVAEDFKKEVRSAYYDDSQDDYYSDYDDKPYEEHDSTPETASTSSQTPGQQTVPQNGGAAEIPSASDEPKLSESSDNASQVKSG